MDADRALGTFCLRESGGSAGSAGNAQQHQQYVYLIGQPLSPRTAFALAT